MKRLLLAFSLLLTGMTYAADDDRIDAATISISSTGTNQRVVQTALIFVNYPTNGERNCITDISVSANAFPPDGWKIVVLDGGTTAYSLRQTTMNIVESWYPKNPLCLSQNTTTWVYVSTGSFDLNMSLYQKKR